jgi:hypothetical protein
MSKTPITDNRSFRNEGNIELVEARVCRSLELENHRMRTLLGEIRADVKTSKQKWGLYWEEEIMQKINGVLNE